MRSFVPSALFLVLAGCGAGLQTRGEAEVAEIDRVRAAAAAHPNDPAAARTLAEWELLGEGGDVARAPAALEHAESLAPSSIALHYLRGVLAEQHGEADAAVDAFVEVLGGAGTDDALTPVLVESTLAYLHELRTDAPRFTERVQPAIEALFRSPGHIGFPARRQAFFWLRDLAIERGDLAEVVRLEAQLLCPTQMRAAGPFGPSVLSGFDVTLPAEGRGPLAARYDLGPGRGVASTRDVEVRRCSATLGRPGDRDDGATMGPGTRVVESTIHVTEPGRYVLALGTVASAQVSIDGTRVARVDRRTRAFGGASFHAIDLAAGDHELELKLSSRAAQPTVTWLLDRATDGYSPETATELASDPEGPLARYATGDVLAIRGEVIAARELLREHVTPDASAALLNLAARVASMDPFASESQRADEERRLVTRATARDEAAYWPRLRTAALETGDVESLDAYRAVADRYPQLATVQLALAAALADAGYDADADLALERAHTARPDACAVTSARFGAALDRGRMDDAAALVDPILACEAASDVRFRLAVRRRDWAAARAEITRLTPFGTREQIRRLELAVAVGAGDTATERRLVAEIEQDAAPSESVIAEADRQYAAGGRARALALLTAEAERSPRRASDLRSLTYALSGDDVMEAYRVDGLDVVRRFEASGRTYEGHAAVLVFDYMATRIFEDGSAVDLVHQIYRVQTAEGVERYGDLPVPGRPLTVRVIGPDGSTREPDSASGNVTMPPLSIGDYVEYETVVDHGPRWGDAYASGGWVFQNFTEPFDHSEIVYVAPTSLDVHFDVRGPVPPAEISERDGLRSYRFVMEQSRRLTEEPHWVAQPPVLPSLRAATRVTWDRMYEAVLDGLLGLDVADPAARRLLDEEILASSAPLTQQQRAQRIHRWVMENVEPVGESFYAPAAAMVQGRRGHRLRVLRYLLELAGIPARIAFSRTITSPEPNDDVPNAEVYDGELVIATLDQGPLYMLAMGRGYAHDYFPPGLAGKEAVVIAQGLPRVQLPTAQGTPSTQRFDGSVDVSPEGFVRVTLQITFTGAGAAELRNAIQQVAPAERATLLAERFVPSIIPGGAADPRSVQLGALDEWEAPFTISFVAESGGMIQPAGDGYHILPLFPSGVEATYARLPSRTTTELVGPVDVGVRLRFTGPGVLHPPRPLEATGPAGARASVVATPQPDGSVQLGRHVVVPLATIGVADYPALVQFAQLTSQIDGRTVIIRPQ